ncbi:cobalamin biosynthesis protein CobW [Minwuia thermotolerans]|uniref:Cobalamin biosynthesis protein CobW n=1 Tax=Minwuia thermotolerans TaxID=2056226 RepID=A0A2M9G602_9PROT|nr:cobalamin biosynthesis protein CobW [Minwuia thermotolerans]PJK31134.1 cobalamin biosynthesis protein CobW [Minwuia thermotolerans]
MSKIPATVVTGFLGAGKTTLIRHLLQNAGGKRIALIINEFGDLGVDGEVLKGCGEETCREEDVVELANGCICCTVADDFIPTMTALLEREIRPDHIVIETSGLALPQPLVKAFNWPDIRTRVTVDGVVTVVDGAAVAEGRFAHDEAALDRQRLSDEMLDHETPLSELFEDQLGCADIVVINKTDLLGEGGLEKVMAELRHDIRPGVQVIRSSHGAVAPAALLGLGIGAEDDIANRPTHHEREGAEDHDHDEFDSFAVELPEIGDPKAFAMQVAQVIRAHDILRLKGFASVAGKPMRLVVQAVGPRIDSYFDRPWRAGEPRGTRLVVIGETGFDRAAIEADLRRVYDRAA